MIYLKGNKTELKAIVFDLGNVLLAYDPARFMFELGIPQEKIPRLIEIIDGRPEYPEYGCWGRPLYFSGCISIS